MAESVKAMSQELYAVEYRVLELAQKEAEAKAKRSAAKKSTNQESGGVASKPTTRKVQRHTKNKKK